MELRLLVGLVAVAACGGGAKAPPPVVPVPTAKVVATPAPPTASGPYDYQTWTAKLGDDRELEHALEQLEQLGNPAAIPALGKAWQEQGRPVRLLQVIIAIAGPLTPEQAKDRFFTDYETTGRPASWAVALPFLVEAMEQVDPANPRSVDSAAKAANAVGDARLVGGLDACAALALRPLDAKLVQAQIVAVASLGRLDADRDRAAAVLVKVVERMPDPAVGAGAAYQTAAAVTAAAVDGIAELRVPAAVPALVIGLYRTPRLFEHYRQALVAIGPTAKAALVDVLQGKNAAVNQLVTARPPTSARTYYAVLVLGYFYDPAIVPELLRALQQPELPTFYIADIPSAASQWNAVFDALHKVGAPAATRALETIWMQKGTFDHAVVRAQAIEAYAYVVRGSGKAAKLGAIAADNSAPDEVRQAAAHTFALISRSAGDIATLKHLANKYLAAAKGKVTDGIALKADADAADAALALRKQTLDAATVALRRLSNDPKATPAAIKQGTQSVQQLESDYRTEQDHRAAAVAPYRDAQQFAAAYTGFARLFLTHIARIEVGMRCGADAKCLVATLDETTAGAKQKLAPLMTDVADRLDTWTPDELANLVAANIERGMIDLGKQGPAAAAYTDALLDHVATTNRTSRTAILLALPKLATLPCTACGVKLDAAIAAGEGQVTLGGLTEQTKLVRSYFQN